MASARQLTILDFDRTLFRTDDFAHDLIHQVCSRFDLDPANFRNQMKQYVLPNEVGYDFYSHAQTVTSLSPEAIDQQLLPALAQNDYVYDDIAPWLSRRHTNRLLIVTVGEPRYQNLKFRFAKALKSIQKIVVPNNKGTVVHQALQGSDPFSLNLNTHDTLTIIDDNPHTFEELSQELNQPNSVHGIYLSRPGEKFAGQTVPPSVATIAGFGELL